MSSVPSSGRASDRAERHDATAVVAAGPQALHLRRRVSGRCGRGRPRAHHAPSSLGAVPAPTAGAQAGVLLGQALAVLEHLGAVDGAAETAAPTRRARRRGGRPPRVAAPSPRGPGTARAARSAGCRAAGRGGWPSGPASTSSTRASSVAGVERARGLDEHAVDVRRGLPTVGRPDDDGRRRGVERGDRRALDGGVGDHRADRASTSAGRRRTGPASAPWGSAGSTPPGRPSRRGRRRRARPGPRRGRSGLPSFPPAAMTSRPASSSPPGGCLDARRRLRSAEVEDHDVGLGGLVHPARRCRRPTRRRSANGDGSVMSSPSDEAGSPPSVATTGRTPSAGRRTASLPG